jgi:hypothetical protein
MADAINTGNPVSTTKFIVNKYDDIDGSRVHLQKLRKLYSQQIGQSL